MTSDGIACGFEKNGVIIDDITGTDTCACMTGIAAAAARRRAPLLMLDRSIGDKSLALLEASGDGSLIGASTGFTASGIERECEAGNVWMASVSMADKGLRVACRMSESPIGDTIEVTDMPDSTNSKQQQRIYVQ